MAPETSGDEPIDPRLVVVTSDPLNAETRLDLQQRIITPNRLFFMRNRFPIPRVDAGSWNLSVSGEVEREMSLSYLDLTCHRPSSW
jgi:DMSO/TMAO reductase YedYZ molybdopterin-dependent catalytic subunit